MIDYIYLKLQNPWWEHVSAIEQDDKVEEFSGLNFQYYPKQILDLKLRPGDVHLITGPRQTGKSTALKLLIRKLINQKLPTKKIFYFNCDALSTEKDLIDLILEYKNEQELSRAVIMLDEVSSISNWPQGIKWLVDAGITKSATILLTGSSSINLKKSGEWLPGRRGQGQDINFLPISFFDYLRLHRVVSQKLPFKELREINDKVRKHFKDFLYTGGFLRNINYGVNETNSDLYIKTLKSELFKAGKKEDSLREVIRKLLSSLSSQTSYTNIAETAELGSKNTALDYLHFLTDSFFLTETKFWEISQKKLILKKNKKFYTVDPYILWLFSGFVYGGLDFKPYVGLIDDSKQIENFVATELTKAEVDFYFYQNHSELDFYLPDQKLGIEVKYKQKLSTDDYKSLTYSPKKLLISQNSLDTNGEVVVVPAYLFSLLDLDF